MLTVAINDNNFEPQSMHVAPGTTITWINRGTHDHTVTSQDGNWDSGEIGPDGAYSARFKKPGTYHYLCDLHEGMQGTIVVGDGGGAAVTDQNAVDRERHGNVNANPPGPNVNVNPPGADVNVNRGGATINTPGSDVIINRNPLPGTQDAPAPQPVPQPAPQP
jgi:hypothetical protein